jgi:hypothetical protein
MPTSTNKIEVHAVVRGEGYVANHSSHIVHALAQSLTEHISG